MVDFSNRNDVESWLRGKPREVVVMFAARSALRVAPLLALTLGPRGGGAGRIVLPLFRGMAVPWVAGLGGKVAAAGPGVGAGRASRAATKAAFAANTSDAAAAAFAAAAAASAAGFAADATRAAARAAARVSAALDAARADAALIGQGADAATLGRRPLWLTAAPDWAREEWGRLERALLKENKDWEVWTDWYRARLVGRPVNLALEVARVKIAEELWNKGPRAVNAEIARLIALHGSPQPRDDILSAFGVDVVSANQNISPLPQPVENIPSAFGFGWTAAGTITLAASPADWPVFPLPASERDHRDRLDTCRALA